MRIPHHCCFRSTPHRFRDLESKNMVGVPNNPSLLNIWNIWYGSSETEQVLLYCMYNYRQALEIIIQASYIIKKLSKGTQCHLHCDTVHRYVSSLISSTVNTGWGTRVFFAFQIHHFLSLIVIHFHKCSFHIKFSLKAGLRSQRWWVPGW